MILTSTHAGVCRPFKSAAPEIPDTPHTATAAARTPRATSSVMSLSGAVCSIMLYSDLAFGATNEVTMEFSTPHGVAPDGILLCGTASDHQFDRSTFVLSRVEEGGSQFVSGTSQTIASSSTSDLLSVRALSGAAAWNHRPVEVGVAADVLGMDAHYADTYARRRYDDMLLDANGASLDGVFQTPTWADDEATRLAASDAVIAQLDAGSLTDTERVVLLQELAELNRPAGNCALLTGTWYADTRYELTFSAPNPPAGSSATTLGWWMAPLSYAATEATATDGAGGMEASSRVTYSVRGDKAGVVCGIRDSVSATLGAASGAGTPVAIGACPTGEARSYRHTGHCVACVAAGGTVGTTTDTDGVTSRTTCACPGTTTTLLAGDTACGPRRGPLGTATTEAELAAEMCASFTSIKTALDGGPAAGATNGVGGGVAAGAHAVAAAHVDAFISAASSLVDVADVEAANATYHATMMFDERAPNDPTRRLGLAPNCQKCERDGTFVDDNGVTGSIKDVRFEAGHALRLIGYVLSLKGYPCDALYDEDNPYASVIGTYDAEPLCEAGTPT